MKLFVYDKNGGGLYGPVTATELAAIRHEDSQIPDETEIVKRLTDEPQFETADYCIIRQ